MKLFLSLLVLFMLAASILLVHFRDQIRAAALDVLVQITKNGVGPMAPENAGAGRRIAPTSSAQKWVPDGFKGPTSEPHIIGPKGDPPNY